MDTPASPFTVFCQKAFDFLGAAGVRHLVISGLAVGVIGEARTTADVDEVFRIAREATIPAEVNHLKVSLRGPGFKHPTATRSEHARSAEC